ncbi:MAG TPA: hypothetical protein VM869_16715, partial [Enhygromyxa sp.]|nr:hypothetical protein [Enhygromyxa sp.]
GDGDGDPACTTLGCECDGSPGSCDNTLMCVDGVCAIFNCGNGNVDVDEDCDDGNRVDGDGCDDDCSFTQVPQLSAGGRHTCALIEGGRVRCWGEGALGITGLGNVIDIGDDESPSASVDIPLPGAAISIEAGEGNVCALFDDDALRCWGLGASGQLGHGNNDSLGDDETHEALAAIDLGDPPDQYSAGGAHVCVRFATNELRCFGRNADGQLGIGSNQNIGDNELPSSIGVITLGAPALAVAAGGDHSCAVTNDLELICWGRGGRGQLGYGNTTTFGNDNGESPSMAGIVDLYPASLPLGTTLEQVSLGKEHSCALFSSGDVLCWGRNDHGQLGQANTDDWGDDEGEAPSGLMPIDLGGSAVAIGAGLNHSCALLEDGDVRCWGLNDKGQLGLGQMGVDKVGDDEAPSSVAAIDLGGPAIELTVGWEHSCARVGAQDILCWGDNPEGRLGYGHTNRIGDDETPASAGAIDLF